MITIQKTIPLKVTRTDSPQSPYWQATTISPYSPLREVPLAIDFHTLIASAQQKLEITACENVRDQIERERRLREPVLIDAAGAIENELRSGERALRFCEESGIASTILIAPGVELPASSSEKSTIALTAWPADPALLESSARRIRDLGSRWGLLLPLVYPLTTSRDLIPILADIARESGAAWVTALPIDLDTSARRYLAEVSDSDEVYQMLFEGDLEGEVVEAERFTSKIAARHGLDDFVSWPDDRRSNWSAAAIVARTATRMIRMKRDVESAWALIRSSRTIAQLNKPLSLIAQSASLSIVDGIAQELVRPLEEWLRTGRSDWFEAIDAQWRDV